MAGQMTTVTAHDGVKLDCYVAMPAGSGKAPVLVMASGAFGLTPGMTEACDHWAGKGFLVAAPELWQRGDKGPISMATDENRKRALARIATPGIFESVRQDLKTVLAHMKADPRSNGRTALMGFCFTGPYAVEAVNDFGCDAAASYHGGGFDKQLDAIKKSSKPLQLHWGDKDFALSMELYEKVKAAASATKTCEPFLYTGGVEHGYTMSDTPVFNAAARDQSWQRTATMFDKLK